MEKLGDKDRDIDMNDLNDLSYLDQVTKETARRFLLFSIIFRHVSEDIKIGKVFMF